jgi:hypothetical protein
VASILLGVLSLPSAAHHSFAIFDLSKVQTVQGTVRAFQWNEPHAWIDLMISGASGEQHVVSFQCLGPGVLRRKGWRRSSLKAGESVRVNFFPERFSRPGGAVRTVTLPDGTVLGSYDFAPLPPGHFQGAGKWQ